MAKQQGRKVFYTKDNKPILASGLILTFNNKLVVQYETKKKAGTKYLSDFGGKLEHYDPTPLDGAIREFMEETNGYLYNRKHNILDYENRREILDYYIDILNRIKKYIYIGYGKYMLYIIEIDVETYEKLIELRVEYKETHSYGISHEIVIKDSLKDDIINKHPRLKMIGFI